MRTFKEYLNEENEPKTVGIHYSNTSHLEELHGSRYGTGIKGAESKRLEFSSDPRIKKRVYFYPKPSTRLPQAESGLGSHVYNAELSNIHDATKPSEAAKRIDAITKHRVEQHGEDRGNAYESAVLDAGFDGYKTGNMVVVMNKNVPVKYMGTLSSGNLIEPKTKEAEPRIEFNDTAWFGRHATKRLTEPQKAWFKQHRDELKKVAPSINDISNTLEVDAEHLPAARKYLAAQATHSI